MNKASAEKFRNEGLLSGKPPTKKEIETLQTKFSTGDEKRVIATSIWSTGVDFPELAVIIRADGGASKIKDIQMPGRVCRRAGGKSRGILVDFADTSDVWTARRARSRLTNYESKGWTLKHVSL